MPTSRKFLKRRETEFARCSEIVNRLSLSRPDVGFRLFHDGKKVLDLGKEMNRFERISSLLGKETLPFLIELPDSGNKENLSFSGWTSAPTINRSNRNSQYLFVNGRAVRDRLLSHAVFEAYRSFLPSKRFPLYCFFIDLFLILKILIILLGANLFIFDKCLNPILPKLINKIFI